jgi:hypothetical protein
MTHLHQYRFYDLDTLLFNCQRSKNFVKSLKLVVELTPNNQPYSFNGGGERDRTDDLLRARQALSQLSYTPNLSLVGMPGGPRWT